MRHLTGQLWCELGAELGEGPFWDPRTGRLGLVDIVTGRLYSGGSDGSLELQVELDTQLGAALPADEDGQFLLACREGFRVLGEDGSIQPYLSVLDDRPDLRFNDAKTDPSGRVLAGTLSLAGEPGQAALYRLTAAPEAIALVSGVGLSNGLGWSPAGDLLYYVDTLADAVYRYPYDLQSGDVGPAETFARAAEPDGMCVDSDGGVWLALWGSGLVHRYAPDGRLDTIVELPVPHATSCAFFDGTLIVTTARASRPDGSASAPHAGDVFAVDVGADAPPATLWQRSVS